MFQYVSLLVKGKGKGTYSCHSTPLYLRVLCNQICSSGQQRRAIKHPLSKNGSTQQHGPGTCRIYYEQSNFNKKKENKKKVANHSLVMTKEILPLSNVQVAQ